MKTRHLIMVIGLGISAWLAFFADKSPTSKIANPVTRNTVINKDAPVLERSTQNKSVTPGQSVRVSVINTLQDREKLISHLYKKPYANGFFGSKNWSPPPPPPPPPTAPPPPMAPPLPFIYIGKKFEGNRWEVYLSRGEQTFIVLENAVIENAYHVDSIKPPILTLTYIPLQQVQTLTIGGAE